MSYNILLVETQVDEVYYKPTKQRTDFSLVTQKIAPTSLLKLITVITFSILLTNCASQKDVRSTSNKAPEKETPSAIKPDADSRSAQYYVEQAKQLPTQQAIATLLKASVQYLLEQNPEKSLWLANQIQPLITPPNTLYRAQLIKAQALTMMSEHKQALAQLINANETVTTHNLAHSFNYYSLLDNVHSYLQHPVEALIAKLHAFKLNTEASEQDISIIWQSLSQLSEWQLQQLEQAKAPYSKGWIRLSKYARRFGSNEAQFERYLKQWQKQYPVHPAQNTVVQMLVESKLDISSATNVAVILPLTGKQAAAGQAAQQGILAAYQEDKSKQLHFINSTELDWTTLETELNDKAIEFIIGPLLRQNVDNFLAIESIETPTLLLNLSQQFKLKSHQSALSMRPEDEAIQAAASLAKKDYKQPLLLVNEDNVSKRIATTFSREWLRLTGKSIEQVSFAQGKNMQDNLNASLDVDKSKERIKQLDIRIKQAIKTESRNRRDVDMIYVIGSPVQTRLIKPYIDVSISPFADPIPIYASSRSHSAKTDENDSQDLAGLTFSEMPWMLPSKQRNKPLFELSKKLFPNRSDSLQGIFAMGYDSMALIDKLPHMKQHNYVRHYGQTGVLKLNENHVLTRSIIWGRYQKSRVQEIGMAR